jgi:hypothetical protein
MARNLPLPFLPVPPEEYDQSYLSEIVRSFSVYMQNERNPGEGRNTFTVFTNLQTDDVGLEPGAVFNHGGYLKVSELNTPHVQGSSATGAVGSVTVSTP